MTSFIADPKDYIGPAVTVVHNVLHRHTQATKPGVGVILLCSNRVTGKLRGRFFAGAFGDEPRWVEVPEDLFAALTAAQNLDDALDLLGVTRHAYITPGFPYLVYVRGIRVEVTR